MSTGFFRPDKQAADTEQPETTAPKDLAALTTPEIQRAALAARATILKRIDGLPEVASKWREESLRITRQRVAVDYREAIEAIREAATREDLQLLLQTLNSRLVAGYAKAPNPTRDALWSRLLAEYEIVMDALADDCMWRFLGRLNDLERFT